ncbi:hypothetical protein FOL47_002593 [Perkinsus chesapeaki]|uniref:Uncharacterized protein n=1 Tax=Perkinsus chesapeaki TaxID=330153 RepID=A0A7J6MEE5_PERCH|nr:hypothetical protein FOL47_002593 [Perkinsus chesapeaki]
MRKSFDSNDSLGNEIGSDSAADSASGTTCVRARISVPVEDLLKQLTSPQSYGDNRAIDAGQSSSSTGGDNGLMTVISTSRMPVRARASNLVNVKYNTSKASYEVEFNIDIDLPTADLSQQILEHVRPQQPLGGVNNKRGLSRSESFDDVPITYVRELGHGGSSVWQAYKAANRWHRSRHRALYFLAKGKRTPATASVMEMDNSVGFNIDAPEFKPEFSSLSPPYPDPINGGGLYRASERMRISPCRDQLTQEEVAMVLGETTAGAGVQDFGSVSTAATESGYSTTFLASPSQVPVDMMDLGGGGDDKFNSWRTSVWGSGPGPYNQRRKHSSSSTSAGFDSSYMSYSPPT